MKKIIVPVDFSEDSVKALKLAISIGEKVQSNIMIIHVKRTKSFAGLFQSADVSLSDEQIEENFQNLLKNIDSCGLVINFTVRKGNISKEIVNYAEQEDAYLIVMGTHGASGFEAFWMGSNAYKVVSNASCPVLSIRSGFERRNFSKIVLPIDTTVNTRQKVPFTADLAKLFNAEVHVISVCTTESDEFVRKVTNYSAQACRYLSEKGVDTVHEFLTGSNITDMAIKYAQEIDADLIAIMTEQETAIENTFLGAYAQQMVHRSPIPVLSMQNNPALEGDISIM